MVLLIDNWDSFVFNLARYLGELGYARKVVRTDAITIEEIEQLKPSHIILSPGPCSPNEAGISLEVVKTFAGKIPLLGVCLGHQAIAQAMGGEIGRAKRPMHGKAALIEHDATGLFQDLPNPLKVGRYHSLIVNTLPDCLRATAWSAEGEIMAFQHINLPVFGLQFHPEAILTSHGHELLNHFLNYPVV